MSGLCQISTSFCQSFPWEYIMHSISLDLLVQVWVHRLMNRKNMIWCKGRTRNKEQKDRFLCTKTVPNALTLIVWLGQWVQNLCIWHHWSPHIRIFIGALNSIVGGILFLQKHFSCITPVETFRPGHCWDSCLYFIFVLLPSFPTWHRRHYMIWHS